MFEIADDGYQHLGCARFADAVSSVGVVGDVLSCFGSPCPGVGGAYSDRVKAQI